MYNNDYNESPIGRYICQCGNKTDNKTGVCEWCVFITESTNEEMII